MQHPQDTGGPMLSPKQRERGAWKKKGWPLRATATQAKLRGDSEHYGWLAPFLNVPQIFPIIVTGFPSPSFLRGLTALPPNSYLEKAATSQIKLCRGFLAPEADGRNSAHPTDLSSPDVCWIRAENLT